MLKQKQHMQSYIHIHSHTTQNLVLCNDAKVTTVAEMEDTANRER